MAKIFNISTDMLLTDIDGDNDIQSDYEYQEKNKLRRVLTVILIVLAIIIILFSAGMLAAKQSKDDKTPIEESTESSSFESNDTAPAATESSTAIENTSTFTPDTTTPLITTAKLPPETESHKETTVAPETTSPPVTTKKDTSKPKLDLFAYCRDFAIEIGNLHGDYTIYQQESTKYGGYENEYFSISYWADSDMVEFCLHCPLSDTLSHNFYLRMRGGYNHKYEYVSSKYYRDTGVSLREAKGYIDPKVFYDGYPISCDKYIGSSDGQTDFMEQTRVGMCDLIRLLKQFVKVEKMECKFSDFEFKNF